uniref:Uncharacterized protein n=1 Tax=Meloidogyne floridensis TaxID=298350 RepID=A0A915PDT3_9BILA
MIEKEKLFKRRHKRGNSWCDCFGDEGNFEEYQRLMGEHQQGHSQGEEEDIPESSSRNQKKRALYICDNFFYSHDMIVYSKEIGTPIELNPMPNDLKIIEMYIDIKHLDPEKITNNRLLEAYNKFKFSKEYVVGIFEVKIGEEYIGILEWILQRNQQQNYSFGIADFTEMAGSFAVFELLGIENTFNVFPSIILPADFQFFGINIVKEIREGHTVIPALNFAKPGDWIFTQDGGCHFKLERFMRNLNEHKRQISSNKKFYQNAVSKILAKTLKIRRENW